MEETNQDLWPDDIGVASDLKPPAEILREQASFLAKKLVTWSKVRLKQKFFLMDISGILFG